MNHSIVLAAVLVFILVLLIARRRVVVLDCLTLLKRLHPHQLRGMDRYLDEDILVDDELWNATGGIPGLWKRWRNRVVLLRLCQLRQRFDGLDDEDMAYVTERIAALTRASFAALLLALVRPLAPRRCDYAVARAFRLYASVADRTHTFFSNDGSPLCATHLASLL